VSDRAMPYIASRHPQKSSGWPGTLRCASPRIALWKACEWAVAKAGSFRMVQRFMTLAALVVTNVPRGQWR
jgi:hypothetical protein